MIVEEEVKNPLLLNAEVLAAESDWLFNIVTHRLQSNQSLPLQDAFPAPELPQGACPYSDAAQHLLWSERVTLILALVPHFRPELLDVFSNEEGQNQPKSEYGGQRGGSFTGFLPTVQTAIFILAGYNGVERQLYRGLFQKSTQLFSRNILDMRSTAPGEPPTARLLTVTNSWLGYLLEGKFEPEEHSPDFPAQLLDTKLTWDDLVLDYDTAEALNEVSRWLKHGSEMMAHKELGRKIKRGYRCLFYGPPGTGKTLTAALLGKHYNMPVYRIDLSMTVSKYIGETEKNLKKVFDRAENENWVLFFDEADSLFGKRTQTSSSNDRYANQEISYLLQRVEDFPGLVVLGSNLKGNIDNAFTRRFQSMIYFPMPSPDTRKTLWKQTFPSDFTLEDCIDLTNISKTHELAGGAILNVVRYCSLLALERGDKVIMEEDLTEGIRRELHKEGKNL
ncbi:ATP-binding protein [Roseivirga sp. BDSF3-8]|uniref:ATP-binding protein n=1 Tax=Roseivirga sp. BDSF3-8 TaxID=3241598 RepID=UPI0035325DAD